MTSTEEPSRLLFGNLGAEDDLAAQLDTCAGRPPRHHPWTRQAVARIAGAATLLRALASPGDRLWTPVPVDPARIADVPGLPPVHLLSGGARDIPPPESLLAWCETAPAAALRGGPPSAADPLPHPALDGPLHEILWQAPRATPDVVAAVNHRTFCLAVQRQLGCAPLGACIVDSLPELAAHLEAGGGADRAPADWVLKAPLSAAGRARVIHRHAADPAGLAGPDLRRRLERLFARHGPLLFEPWMARTADFGAAGLLLEDGVRWLGFHRQSVDSQGRFLGVEVDAEPTAAPGLPAADRARWLTALDAAAAALHRAAYRGPFGIDAWQHRDAAGTLHLHPLGEINARLTFGLIARALVDRLREPLHLAPGDRVHLAFGPSLPAPAAGARAGAEGEPTAAAPALVPLLHAQPTAPSAAWLEIIRRAEALRHAGSQSSSRSERPPLQGHAERRIAYCQK